MRKNRRNLGFTMAEMLIVVAIIMVLAGVAFIAVQNHQRSMAQLDRNTIAKEIFIAAQNHLTMAESQGYLSTAGTVDFGTPDTSDNTVKNVYYIGSDFATQQGKTSMLGLMLPFGSIDETVRAGGSYMVRYQSNPAQILDVFYCSKNDSPARFNHTIVEEDYPYLMEEKGTSPGNYIVGWYGGADALSSTDYGNYELIAPTVELENGERLVVRISEPNKDRTDPNDNISYTDVKLIISGETSGAEASIKLADMSDSNSNHIRFTYNVVDKNYIVILDDITKAGLHFDEMNTTTDQTIEFKSTVVGSGTSAQTKTNYFIPGENITVQAVAYSNTALTNIAYSNAVTTNSLFADIDEAGETAMIGAIRHLENLDANNSHLDNNDENSKLDITKAMQIGDLNWNEFVEELGTASDKDTAKTVKIVPLYVPENKTTPDGYLPVNPSHWEKKSGGNNTTTYTASDVALTYDGKALVTTKTTQTDPEDSSKTIAVTSTTSFIHSVTGVQINGSGDAGLFGTLISGSSVANLELVDFSVETSEGNAGALAGTMTGTTVTNVVAYNTTDFETELAKTDATKTTVSTTSGSAGGLIGSIDGATSVSKSAAALIVSATGGNAGGLIGTSAGGAVSGCYAGGHTILSGEAVMYSDTAYNVTAARAEGATTGGVAGGLIGDAGSTEISYSYSTCSAKGVTVGGLIGTGSGAITSSYCTGKVSGTTQGAFAGACGTTTDCHYFEIINEFTDATMGYDYLTPIPKVGEGDGTKDGITALDVTAEEYNKFCGASEEWKSAVPYRASKDTPSVLETYYGGKYNLETVEQLMGGTDPLKEDEADTTEYFVATHYGDWPVPEIFVVNTKGTTATPATPTP